MSSEKSFFVFALLIILLLGKFSLLFLTFSVSALTELVW